MNRLLVIAGSLAIVHSVYAQSIPVTTCGQTIPRSRTGILSGNLTCTAVDQFTVDIGVVLENNARLDLNGFKISVSGDTGPIYGVFCSAGCAVFSSAAPGEIETAANGAAIYASGKIRATNLSLYGNGGGIVGHERTHVYATNVDASNNILWGVGVVATVRAESLTTNNNQHGIAVEHKVRGNNITANGNLQWGIDAGRSMNGTNVTVMNNGVVGIDTSTAGSDNLGRIVLRSSTVTGNPLDLVSNHRPRLTDTTCGVSAKQLDPEPGDSWFVCAND